MTINEKRKALADFCDTISDCMNCQLYHINCDLTELHDAEIDEIYEMVFPITVTNKDSEDELMNVRQHLKIVTEMNELYKKKNKDYGDSFHASFVEEGMAMVRIRLGDKLNRFKTLTKSNHQEVKDESIRDTLIDLANYAVMTVMEIDRKDNDNGSK